MDQISKIVERIGREAGTPDLAQMLSHRISASDLQSLLMRVYQARVSEAQLPALRTSAERGLLRPSKVDGRRMSLFDRVAFEVASRFECVDLSPVCPLGLNHLLGGIHQNSVLTTIRNAEVLGDATMPLAMECARRRREAGQNSGPAAIRLAASHRVIRLQPFDFEGYVPHFRLFSMITAGRDTGSLQFEIEHLKEHIRSYLQLFRTLAKHGFSFEKPLVELSDTGIIRTLLEAAGVTADDLRETIRAHRPGGSEKLLRERGIVLPDAVRDPAAELGHLPVPGLSRLVRMDQGVFDTLRAEFPEADFRFNLARLEGLGYYSGFCLRISPLAPDGERYPVADGGFTDWTARLLQNRKERLLTSGIGTEFVCLKYRSG